MHELKLYHGKKLVGMIHDASMDGFNVSGQIELTADAAKYMDLFEFFRDEHNALYVDPPFGEDMLLDWDIEDEDGKRSEILIPIVMADGEFRCRI